MVEDEPDGDVQNAEGGVVDEQEGFEVEGVDSVAPGRRARGGGFPSLQHLPLDRTRVRTVGHCGGDEPRVMCRSPHLLYIWHCATGAHQPHIALGVPDQDASQGWPSRWTGPVEINTNIYMPNLFYVLHLGVGTHPV